MSREILLLVDALAHEKNVNKDVVFEALESALASATKKKNTEDIDVRVEIDRDTGEYKSFRRWTFLNDELIENEDAQISLLDPRAEGKAENDTIEVPLESIEFGRIGAQAAKQVILQKVREAEREQILEDFLGRNEKLVTGVIKRMDRGNGIIEVGRIEAILGDGRRALAPLRAAGLPRGPHRRRAGRRPPQRRPPPRRRAGRGRRRGVRLVRRKCAPRVGGRRVRGRLRGRDGVPMRAFRERTRAGVRRPWGLRPERGRRARRGGRTWGAGAGGAARATHVRRGACRLRPCGAAGSPRRAGRPAPDRPRRAEGAGDARSRLAPFAGERPYGARRGRDRVGRARRAARRRDAALRRSSRGRVTTALPGGHRRGALRRAPRRGPRRELARPGARHRGVAALASAPPPARDAPRRARRRRRPVAFALPGRPHEGREPRQGGEPRGPQGPGALRGGLAARRAPGRGGGRARRERPRCGVPPGVGARAGADRLVGGPRTCRTSRTSVPNLVRPSIVSMGTGS